MSQRQELQNALDKWWNTTDRSIMSFFKIKVFRSPYRSIPLHVAAECGDHFKMEMILSSSKVEIDETVLPSLDTALHCASTAKCVQLLVEHGFSLEKINRFRMTPIHVASYNDHLEALEQLVICGGDVNATIRDVHPFNATGLVSEIPTLHFLLRTGCEMTTASFHRQINFGNFHIVEEVINLGVYNVNAIGFKGRSALHVTCRNKGGRGYRGYHEKRFRIARLLIENGIKTNTVDADGKTAWHWLNKTDPLNNELLVMLEKQMELESNNFGFTRSCTACTSIVESP